MHQALYRAYRPEVFSQVLGQEHIVKILQHQIEVDETVHAYLFCGTRGTGKTTLARILAKAVNCRDSQNRPCGGCDSCMSIKNGSFMDLIEIDAASNTGVDNIRELRESVQYPPSVGKKKVYIIDEVHMLSSNAFNALLKTLEEPPRDVMFILATTEPEKLPATVLSRCMRMDFRRVPESVIKKGMRRICKDKEVTVEESGLQIIVAAADGSVRDGLTLLDQCISMGEATITEQNILDCLGTVGTNIYIYLTEVVRGHAPAEGLMEVHKLLEDGKDPRQILQGWMSHYRNLLLAKFLKRPEDVLLLSSENIERIRKQSEAMTAKEINRAIMEISSAIPLSRSSSQPRIILEMVVVKLSTESETGQVVLQNRRPIKNEAETVNINGKEEPRQASMTEPTSQLENKPPGVKAETINVEKANNTEVMTGDQKGGEVSAESEADEADRESLWEAFLDEGEATHGAMFGMVRNNAEPVSMKKNTMTVKVKGITKGFMEKNISSMEDILEKYGGCRRCLVLLDEKEADKKDIHEPSLVNAVEAALGIKVEVK